MKWLNGAVNSENPNRMHIIWATVNNKSQFSNQYMIRREGCRRRRRRRRSIPVLHSGYLSSFSFHFVFIFHTNVIESNVFFGFCSWWCCCCCCWQAVKNEEEKINKFQFLFSTVVKSTTLIITTMLGIQYLFTCSLGMCACAFLYVYVGVK